MPTYQVVLDKNVDDKSVPSLFLLFFRISRRCAGSIWRSFASSVTTGFVFSPCSYGWLYWVVRTHSAGSGRVYSESNIYTHLYINVYICVCIPLYASIRQERRFGSCSSSVYVAACVCVLDCKTASSIMPFTYTHTCCYIHTYLLLHTHIFAIHLIYKTCP